MHDDDRTPELSPPPSTPAVMWRVAPLVVAALGAAGCAIGEPASIDAGTDAGGLVADAGIQDAGIQPAVVDAGIEAPSDSGPSTE